MLIDVDKLSRVAVVDRRADGLVIDAWAVDVVLDLQDDGETLKVFLLQANEEKTAVELKRRGGWADFFHAIGNPGIVAFDDPEIVDD